MRTSWPRRVNSATPEGVIATRNSLFLTSVGIPTRIPSIVKKLRVLRKDTEDSTVYLSNERRSIGECPPCGCAVEGSSTCRFGRYRSQDPRPAARRCPDDQQRTGRGTRHRRV